MQKQPLSIVFLAISVVSNHLGLGTKEAVYSNQPLKGLDEQSSFSWVLSFGILMVHCS